MIRPMALKTYSDEFRRQAVDLYQSTPGATLKSIAADLGISCGTLSEWVQKPGTGTTALMPGTPPPTASRRRGRTPRPAAAPDEPAAARIARLEARVAELEAEHTTLATERDILRQAAKYFAGETKC